MSWMNESEFEPVVREAMQARPQPRSISNLAFRAMELARQQARVLARPQLEGLIRLRRRTMWVGMVAAILVAVVVWVGASKLVKTGAMTMGYTNNTSSEQSATDSASSGNGPILSAGAVVTAELLVVAMILLSGGMFWPRQGEV
jgi:hypothetical protein